MRGQSPTLKQIKLEPARPRSESSSSSDDEEDGEVYTCDAIKFAVYCDKKSVPINAEGKRVPGWRYGVLWQGYEHPDNDTEEPYDSFGDQKDRMPDLLWQALGLPIKLGEVEPAGKPGQLYETPPHLMKQWLDDSNRDYNVYRERRKAELAKLKLTPTEPPNKAAKGKQVVREGSPVKSKNTSTNAKASSSRVVRSPGSPEETKPVVKKLKTKVKTKVIPPSSPASSEDLPLAKRKRTPEVEAPLVRKKTKSRDKARVEAEIDAVEAAIEGSPLPQPVSRQRKVAEALENWKKAQQPKPVVPTVNKYAGAPRIGRKTADELEKEKEAEMAKPPVAGPSRERTKSPPRTAMEREKSPAHTSQFGMPLIPGFAPAPSPWSSGVAAVASDEDIQTLRQGSADQPIVLDDATGPSRQRAPQEPLFLAGSDSGSVAPSPGPTHGSSQALFLPSTAPTQPASTTLSHVPSSSSNAIPVTDRPKYKQTSRIKIVDVVGDPTKDKSLRANPTKKPPPPPPEPACRPVPPPPEEVDAPRTTNPRHKPPSRRAFHNQPGFVPYEPPAAASLPVRPVTPNAYNTQQPAFVPRNPQWYPPGSEPIPHMQQGPPPVGPYPAVGNGVYQPRQVWPQEPPPPLPPLPVLPPAVVQPHIVGPPVPVPMDPRRRQQAAAPPPMVPEARLPSPPLPPAVVQPQESVTFHALADLNHGKEALHLEMTLSQVVSSTGPWARFLLGAEEDGSKRKVLVHQVEAPVADVMAGLDLWEPLCSCAVQAHELHTSAAAVNPLVKALTSKHIGTTRIGVIWFEDPDPVTGQLFTFSLIAFSRTSPLATKLACTQDAAVLAVILRSQPTLESIPLPLPNPMSSRYKVDIPTAATSDLADSAELGDRALAMYGFTTDFFDPLRGKQAMLYNTKATRPPFATPWTQPIWDHLERVAADKRIVDAEVILVPNANMAMFSRSSFNLQRPKKTRFYSFGPAFDVHPSLWQLRPIWKTGALVTFSPAFILRHSKELAKILRDMKSCKTWDAYVIPPIVRYCNASFSVQRRCPDPKLALHTLTDAIGMDKMLHLLGGDIGGHQSMAIATTPPSSVDKAARSQWLKRQLDFERLEEWEDVVEHCKGVWPSAFPKPDWDEPDFNIGDLEQAQLADLHAMMVRPESIPYRRFIYLGEISTPFQRERYQGLEPLSLDQFHAAFASAI